MNHPTVIKLLREGCTLMFPSGFGLCGDPENDYIEIFHRAGDAHTGPGIWPLDGSGLSSAMRDIREREREVKA